MRRPSTPEDAMRGFLSSEDPGLARMRRGCEICPTTALQALGCAVRGPAGAVIRHVGFARFASNPAICGSCIKGLDKLGVFGAEVPVSLFLADIRDPTGIGERSSPTEFRAFLDRFYRLSSGAVVDNDGMVDKFVGEEVIGLFFPGISGAEHAAATVRAARALLDAVGQPDASQGGAIPVGAAVHTGDAFVGSTGGEWSGQ